MSTSRALLAVFLCFLSLHLGWSMDLPPVIWLGSLTALLAAPRLVTIERPTLGLGFVLFATGAFLGDQVLQDWAAEDSWPAQNGLSAGFVLSLQAYLLWLFAARPYRHNASCTVSIDKDQQSILAWGLVLMLLLPSPETGVMNISGIRLAPVPLLAMLLAAVVMLSGRCAGMLRSRLLMLLPLLALLPAMAIGLGAAQTPVLGLLGDLVPRPDNFSATGFSPSQQLRASSFLRPSNRAVMRIQTEATPGKYLVGNRLTTLTSDLVWLAEERPLSSSPIAQMQADGEYRYALDKHHAPTEGGLLQTLSVHSLNNDNYLFTTPDTGMVQGSFDSLMRNSADVWIPRFQRGADRRWRLHNDSAPTPDSRRAINLQLPAQWNDALQARSLELAGATDASTVANVLTYFGRRNYSLSTSFDPARPLQDFFLNDRDGYCYWFATATALALRANGIPSRLVGGYVLHEQLAGNLWLVRERDAHSWVEWQDDQGFWHTIDPTPSSVFAFFDGYRSSALSTWYHRLAGQWRMILDRLLASPTSANLIFYGGMAILVFLFVREYRRIRNAAGRISNNTEQWRRLWQRFLACTGLPDQLAWTAGDYMDRLPKDWPASRRQAVRQFLEHYQQYRFSADSKALERMEQAITTCQQQLTRGQPAGV